MKSVSAVRKGIPKSEMTRHHLGTFRGQSYRIEVDKPDYWWLGALALAGWAFIVAYAIG